MGNSFKPMDRRNFLKMSAVAAGAALAAGGISGCSPSSSESATSASAAAAGTGVSPLDPSDEWYFDFSTLPPLSEATDDADVVVIGSGFGGYASAITASDLGLKVIMLEALSEVGGTSNFAEGTFTANCDLILDANLGVSDQWMKDLVEEKLEFSHYRADRDCIKALIDGGADVGNWMTEIGVPFQPVDDVDILGRKKEFITGLNYEPNASAAIDVMEKHAPEAGVEVRMSTKALHLYLEGDTVQGVYVEGPDGEYAIRSKAVILACGGFGNDKKLIKAKTGFDPERIIYTGMPGAGTGDGIRMAYECGGEQNATACPGFVWPAIDGISIHTQASVIACNEMGLWVNQAGKRFVNEDIVYDITGCCNLILGQKHVWSIVPQNEVDRHMVEPCTMGWGSYVTFGSVMTEVQKSLDEYTSKGLPNAVKADTLEELAQAIDVDKAALLETIDHYNAMCEAGEDTEFGKAPQVLHALEKGPYYAFELYTNAPTTLGGIRINADCQVLDTNFDVIPGLYSASADNSGLSGDTYHNNPGGLTSGMALGCGRRSARAVQEYIKTLA